MVKEEANPGMVVLIPALVWGTWGVPRPQAHLHAMGTGPLCLFQPDTQTLTQHWVPKIRGTHMRVAKMTPKLII